MKKETVCVITLGCKVNLYEGQSIINELIKRGYTVKTNIDFADVYVINTCAVTNEAEKKSRMYVTKLLSKNPAAKVFICGCSSENHPEDYLKKDNVYAVSGTAKKMKLVDKIESVLKTNKKIDVFTTEDKSVYDDTMLASKTRTRMDLKIQDGCDDFCSYCIIPYVRGRSRSRSLASIEKEIEYQQNFTKEIVLAGINLSRYGQDFKDKKGLVDVARLFKNKNIRLRLSSLEAGIIDEELLKELKQMDNFCPHFHLSLQSGSNDVLKTMNRKYSVEDFIKKVTLIRKYFKYAGITTDIIVGFPTETEENFQETLNTVKKAAFSDIHIFPYSKRDGTVAAKYGILDGKIVKDREKRLAEVKYILKNNFINQNLGRTENVLIENISNTGVAEGFTKNYIKCYIKNAKNYEAGDCLNVKLIKNHSGGVLAEPVK